ncbi:MAG: hypothetical protein M3Y34_05710 [Actinomycetota bacterium]|nr:hypothetical protein [Actinomycetota bacterium]
MAALLCASPAGAGVTQHGDLGLVYEQTTTNFAPPPSRGTQSSYNPCDAGDTEGLPLLSGGGWVYDSDPLVTPFDPGQAYFVGLKFRSQLQPNTPESWHEVIDNVSSNTSLGMGELTVCGDVNDVSYQKGKAAIPRKDSGSATARCSGGDHVLGGGGLVKGRFGKPRLVGSYPIDGADGNETPDDGWRSVGYNGAKKKKRLFAYAVCAPLDGLEYREASAQTGSERLQAEIFCGPGEHAIGGGFRTRGDLSAARAVESRTEPPGDRWRLTVDSFAPNGVRADFHVICHS